MWEVFYFYIKRDHVWNLRPMDRVWELWHNVWSIFHYSITIVWKRTFKHNIHIYIICINSLTYTYTVLYIYTVYINIFIHVIHLLKSILINHFHFHSVSVLQSIFFAGAAHHHRRPWRGEIHPFFFVRIISREMVNQRNRSFLKISYVLF